MRLKKNENSPIVVAPLGERDTLRVGLKPASPATLLDYRAAPNALAARALLVSAVAFVEGGEIEGRGGRIDKIANGGMLADALLSSTEPEGAIALKALLDEIAPPLEASEGSSKKKPKKDVDAS